MRSNRLLSTAAFLAAVALAIGAAWHLTNRKEAFLGYPGENQSRNIPAGSVSDPGSHLTFIVDTGVNARHLIAASPPPGNAVADLGLDQDGDGWADPGSTYSNFITVVNTNPFQAVTLHIRYFNDNCTDLLDFLVVLACNQSLMFDPFDFLIPYTTENTKNRFLYREAAAPGSVLPTVTNPQWGSGRFLITVAAVGASTDGDDDAEILFPYEARSLGKCNMNAAGDFDPNATLPQTMAGSVRNVGARGSISSQNLHVYDASQISFDYLVGMQTVAVPKAFIPGTSQDQFLSYGMSAWARPAVDRNLDEAVGASGRPDGDGPNDVPTGKIILGSEDGYSSSHGSYTATPDIPRNGLFLRNEVHGGDIRYVAPLGSASEYGALATAPFHGGLDPRNAVMHFVSVVDDYNGSNNSACGESAPYCDRSANVGAAFTTYVMQIYDTGGHLLHYTIPPPPPISPLPGCDYSKDDCEVTLKLTCVCLRTFLTEYPSAVTNVDSLTAQDLVDFYGPAITQGCTQTGSTCNPLFQGLLHGEGVGRNVTGGWIRFVRDNTQTVRIQSSIAEQIGFFPWDAYGTGTSSVSAGGTRSDYHAPFGASFLTVGQQIARFGGLGSGWWMHATASCPSVSDTGDETACAIDTPNP